MSINIMTMKYVLIWLYDNFLCLFRLMMPFCVQGETCHIKALR